MAAQNKLPERLERCGGDLAIEAAAEIRRLRARLAEVQATLSIGCEGQASVSGAISGAGKS